MDPRLTIVHRVLCHNSEPGTREIIGTQGRRPLASQRRMQVRTGSDTIGQCLHGIANLLLGMLRG